MPNREWRGNIIGTSNFFLNELAAALPSLISLLLRLAALYLFFWYLFAFCCEFRADSLPLTILSGIAALLAAVLLIWKVINSRSKFDLDKNIQPAGLLPFVLLDLIPITAVAFATWVSNYEFCPGLLRFTQCALKRIGIVLVRRITGGGINNGTKSMAVRSYA